jgi:hypothetical protein
VEIVDSKRIDANSLQESLAADLRNGRNHNG